MLRWCPLTFSVLVFLWSVLIQLKYWVLEETIQCVHILAVSGKKSWKLLRHAGQMITKNSSLFTHGSKLPSFKGGLKWGKETEEIQWSKWENDQCWNCNSVGIPWNLAYGIAAPFLQSRADSCLYNRNSTEGRIHHRRSAQRKPGWCNRPSKCLLAGVR